MVSVCVDTVDILHASPNCSGLAGISCAQVPTWPLPVFSGIRSAPVAAFTALAKRLLFLRIRILGSDIAAIVTRLRKVVLSLMFPLPYLKEGFVVWLGQ